MYPPGRYGFGQASVFVASEKAFCSMFDPLPWRSVVVALTSSQIYREPRICVRVIVRGPPYTWGLGAAGSQAVAESAVGKLWQGLQCLQTALTSPFQASWPGS